MGIKLEHIEVGMIIEALAFVRGALIGAVAMATEQQSYGARAALEFGAGAAFDVGVFMLLAFGLTYVAALGKRKPAPAPEEPDAVQLPDGSWVHREAVIDKDANRVVRWTPGPAPAWARAEQKPIIRR